MNKIHVEYSQAVFISCVTFLIHGQAGRSTVWANGTQNLGLVNFVPESRLPFVQISSIYQKTTAKALTRIKDGFEEMDHGFPFGYSVRKNRTTFSDVPLLPEIFWWNDPKSLACAAGVRAPKFPLPLPRLTTKSRVPFTFEPYGGP